MSSNQSLTTAEILAIFTEEVAGHQGAVTDTFNDGSRLLTRSVLSRIEEVRPKDQLQGGVALRACGGSVWVHPYVFRLICRNGAIMPQTLHTERLTHLDQHTHEEASWMVREAIQACCAPEVFSASAQQFRSARQSEADLALQLLPLMARFSQEQASDILSEIMDRLFKERDDSRFGLVNAVTALARDTRDPELRWYLEELGGRVAAADPEIRPRRPTAAKARGAVLVG